MTDLMLALAKGFAFALIAFLAGVLFWIIVASMFWSSSPTWLQVMITSASVAFGCWISYLIIKLELE